MMEEDATKCELHQQVDDLQDEIFDMIENKRESLLEEKKNLVESGILES